MVINDGGDQGDSTYEDAWFHRRLPSDLFKAGITHAADHKEGNQQHQVREINRPGFELVVRNQKDKRSNQTRGGRYWKPEKVFMSRKFFMLR